MVAQIDESPLPPQPHRCQTFAEITGFIVLGRDYHLPSGINEALLAVAVCFESDVGKTLKDGSNFCELRRNHDLSLSVHESPSSIAHERENGIRSFGL